MTKREKLIAVGLVLLWAVLFLPNLRTSPKWYGDEGEWMEKCWTFIHGTPRVGPVVNDFIFPYPYPPLYMLVNGALLRVFGYDLVVSRALGAALALAGAGILFWIGTRLRDKIFGFVCAAVFLVYDEAVMNFRWVRSHPMAGVLVLVCVGFLVRYVQERRRRDIALAGLFCALATATHYMTYPLAGAVVVTAFVVNWGRWREAVVAALIGGATAGAYAAGFVVWYVTVHGAAQLLAQVGRLTSVAGNEARPTWWGEVCRFAENVWTLGFKTPTHGPPPGWSGRDWWLVMATAGFVFLPVRDWKLRLWVPVWLLVLMYGVFQKLNNVPLFFYPATIFLPLLAVGFAGGVTWAGELVKQARVAPAVAACAVFGAVTLPGVLGGFHSKIDLWAQQSAADGEAAMRFVNERVGREDFVIVPKQIYWLAKTDRRSMLTYCARYSGVVNDMPVPVAIPRELYWFDCRLENAKYLVLEYGVTEQRLPVGIDAVYTSGLRGVREVLMQVQQEQWPVVFRQGAYLVFANPRFAKS